MATVEAHAQDAVDAIETSTNSEQSFDTAIANEATNKNKKLKWDKLPKYSQWKLFKSYMHENEITDGNLFKRMKSMISEKKTDAFVTYDIVTQCVTHVDFKHETFIRERSKKKKLQVQLAQAAEEEKVKKLEAELEGLSVAPENVEVVYEESIPITDE